MLARLQYEFVPVFLLFYFLFYNKYIYSLCFEAQRANVTDFKYDPRASRVSGDSGQALVYFIFLFAIFFQDRLSRLSI